MMWCGEDTKLDDRVKNLGNAKGDGDMMIRTRMMMAGKQNTRT